MTCLGTWGSFLDACFWWLKIITYSAVILWRNEFSIKYTYNRHSIAHPGGWALGCRLWVQYLIYVSYYIAVLTHWGRVTHICIGKQTVIGSDNGLSPGRRQAIIWTNAGKLLFGPPGTNFGEILIEIHTFSFKKMHFKMSSVKWRPICFGLNVLNMMSMKET